MDARRLDGGTSADGACDAVTRKLVRRPARPRAGGQAPVSPVKARSMPVLA